MKIQVLYEDSNILAIDKPAGILVHPALEQAQYGAGPEPETILSLFKKKYPKLEIVHRLDKETSGVLLLAKNAKAHEYLKKQFQARTIKKVYNAIVSGSVKNDRGVINKPIGRSPKDFRRWLAGRGARGELREAITEYRVLKRLDKFTRTPKTFGVTPKGGGFTFLEVRPKTGRTHQIRVHMKFVNHPVVCDSLYNPDGECPKGLKRVALHALSIEFKDLKGKIIKIESPLALDIKKVIK